MDKDLSTVESTIHAPFVQLRPVKYIVRLRNCTAHEIHFEGTPLGFVRSTMQKVQLFIIDAVLMEVKELTNMSRYVNMKIQAKETESLESISEMRLHVGYASDLDIREMACVIKVYSY